MSQLLKIAAVATLIIGSTSSISGATETACLLPIPKTLDAALSAKPPAYQGKTPYEELVLHPAFGKGIKNTGTFILTSENTLLRYQNTPQVEEMEIGTEAITIRRNGSEVIRSIPKQMKPFFALLQTAILGQPFLQHDDLKHQIKATLAGWNTDISLGNTGKGLISFSGCGTLLHSIGLKLRNGQQRTIRFGVK